MNNIKCQSPHCQNFFDLDPKQPTKRFCDRICHSASYWIVVPCSFCQTSVRVSAKKSSGNKFCSKSHAAQYNNQFKPLRTIDSRKKTSESIIKYCRSVGMSIQADIPTVKKKRDKRAPQPPRKLRTVSIEHMVKKATRAASKENYSVVRRCNCNTCGKGFVSRTPRKFCEEHKGNYSRNHKARFRFQFNIYDYGDLFDLSLIAQHGWFSPGGKCNKAKNLDGMSRDHKVSVSDAIKYDHDPYYISHPMNCELMHHSMNNAKKSTSSISYHELLILVDTYDRKGLGI